MIEDGLAGTLRPRLARDRDLQRLVGDSGFGGYSRVGFRAHFGKSGICMDDSYFHSRYFSPLLNVWPPRYGPQEVSVLQTDHKA